ncbi:lysine transporter LysE [Streptomyces crystallinus]|uniref:Lysine transporter LysE n=1 Tax=Streptomyces crystallinus TaxID=68191 RepID=A0ABN1GRV4_9ACTN
MGVRKTARVTKVAKSVGEFLVEMVGELVGEAIMQVLACLLLACLVLIVYVSWSFSPRLTVAGAGLFSLLLAHGAWKICRDPAKGRGRRGLAAVTTVCFGATATTAAFLLFYAPGCGCL